MEDEALLAVMVAEILEGAGATVVGPAATLQKALGCWRRVGTSISPLLDVNLRGENIDPIAAPAVRSRHAHRVCHRLRRGPAGPWTDAPVIGKPFTEADLLCAIRQAFKTNRDVVID